MQVLKSADLLNKTEFEENKSDWFKITQERINEFANSTLDHQFIHVNPEKAAKTPFKGTIAHGMLTLSLIGHFAKQFAIEVEGTKIAVNYGFDKVRFLAPVPVNSEIRAIAKIANVEIKPDSNKFLITYGVTVEINGNATPALITEWKLLIITNS